MANKALTVILILLCVVLWYCVVQSNLVLVVDEESHDLLCLRASLIGFYGQNPEKS